MAIFRQNPIPTPLRRGSLAPTARFPQRIQPPGTRKGPQVRTSNPVMTHFDRSMAAQAARVPRLANIQDAARTIARGGAVTRHK